jgi:WD40 repeat protein
MEIMMRMSSKNMQMLRRWFKRDGDSVTLAQFTALMIAYLHTKSKKRSDQDILLMRKQLGDLFGNIDVSGQGTIGWELFTNFIVNSNTSGLVNRVDPVKKWTPSLVSTQHSHAIDQMFYFSRLDRLVLFEQNQRSFKIVNPATLKVETEVFGHRGVLLGAAHVSHRNLLATSSNDLRISFWDGNTFLMRHQIRCHEVQMVLHWSEPRSILYSGGISGKIYGWDMESLAQQRPVLMVDGHSDVVMDLESIPTMDVLASASLDTNICLWDMVTGNKRKTLKGGHTKGVCSLAYSSEYRFLASAGFDHEAVVWNPYVENLICRLKGHHCSLIGVEMNRSGGPEIITADVSGVVKVWDVRNFQCVQTFSGSAGNAKSLQSFALTDSSKRLVAASPHSLHLFETAVIETFDETPGRTATPTTIPSSATAASATTSTTATGMATSQPSTPSAGASSFRSRFDSALKFLTEETPDDVPQTALTAVVPPPPTVMAAAVVPAVGPQITDSTRPRFDFESALKLPTAVQGSPHWKQMLPPAAEL